MRITRRRCTPEQKEYLKTNRGYRDDDGGFISLRYSFRTLLLDRAMIDHRTIIDQRLFAIQLQNERVNDSRAGNYLQMAYMLFRRSMHVVVLQTGQEETSRKRHAQETY